MEFGQESTRFTFVPFRVLVPALYYAINKKDRSMTCLSYLVRHKGLRSPYLPVGQAGLPSCAPSFRALGPLTTGGITGASRFTFVPFRVRVPSIIYTKNEKTHLMMGFPFLVRHKGLEPLTFAFVVRYSIQLS